MKIRPAQQLKLKVNFKYHILFSTVNAIIIIFILTSAN